MYRAACGFVRNICGGFRDHLDCRDGPHAPEIDPRFTVALVMCYETRHRPASVRQLRWADIDFTTNEVRWRAEHRKNRVEHRTPLSDAALDALRAYQRTDAGTGKQFLFPSQSTGQPLRRESFTTWWGLARKQAGIVGSPGARHKLRREFATNPLDQPVKVVQELGGWENPTVLTQLYQTVDMQRMRDALKSRKAVSNPQLGYDKGHPRRCPTSLQYKEMGLVGVEPTTSRLSGVRSNHLS